MLGPVSGAHFNPAVSLVQVLGAIADPRSIGIRARCRSSDACLALCWRMQCLRCLSCRCPRTCVPVLRSGCRNRCNRRADPGRAELQRTGDGSHSRGGVDRCRLLVYRFDLVRQSGDHDRSRTHRYLRRNSPRGCSGIHRRAAHRRVGRTLSRQAPVRSESIGSGLRCSQDRNENAMSEVTIYHNPDCGTSRNTLALIRNAGIEPTVIEYLKNPPARSQLASLIRDAGLSVRQALREKGTPFNELGLGDPALSDDLLLDAMMAHPILINRPVCRRRARHASVPAFRGCARNPAGARRRGRSPRKTVQWSSTHRGIVLSDFDQSLDLPNVRTDVFARPDTERLLRPPSTHPPRILLLYGSLRTRSYSRFLTQEAARLLESFGAETRIFDPQGLPLPDSVSADHPRSRSFVRSRYGPRGTCGAVPSDMARSAE